jgi:hypothetical protein
MRYIRGLVTVLFKEGATQIERHAAVAAAGGVVIGGVRIAGADGYDLIRIVADTSVRASRSAVGILKSLPQVEEASIERASARLSLRRASDGTAWRQVKQSAVPAVAPDSVPFSAISRLFYPADGGWPYAQDVLMLRFRPGTPVGERSRVISLVSGTVIGGKRDVTAEGGVYVIGLPRDSTQATLLAARGRLRNENAVLTVWLYEFAPVDPANRSPNDRLVLPGQDLQLQP